MNAIIEQEPETATGTALVVVRTQAPSIIAADKNDEDLLGKLAEELAAFKPDISTATGRAAIRAMQRKVSSTKARLVEKATAMKADALKLQRAVNAEVKVLEERMDGLRDSVGLELDEYEQRDRDRIAEHERLVGELAGLRDFGPRDPSVAEIQQRLARLHELAGRDWQEFRARATEARVDSLDRLTDMLAAAERREREQEELAELRRQKAENDRVAAHQAAIAQISSVAVFDPGTGSGPDGAVTSFDVAARVRLLKKPAAHDFQEYQVQANETRAMTVQRLEAMQAELEAAEKAAQEEHDARVAAAAAAEAEERAKADRLAREAAEAGRERDRKRVHADAIAAMKAIADSVPADAGSQSIAGAIRHVERLYERDWQEFAEEAAVARMQTLDVLAELRDAAIGREHAAAEAQRLAAMRADLEAMTALVNFDGQGSGPDGAVTAADVAARIRVLGRFAAHDFGELAADAEHRFAAASAALEAKKAEVVAAERAARDAEQAARDEETRKREQARLETLRRQEEATAAQEARKREQNKAHKAKINRRAMDALMVAAPLTEEHAQNIIIAIARGEIPAVTIAY